MKVWELWKEDEDTDKEDTRRQGAGVARRSLRQLWLHRVLPRSLNGLKYHVRKPVFLGACLWPDVIWKITQANQTPSRLWGKAGGNITGWEKTRSSITDCWHLQSTEMTKMCSWFILFFEKVISYSVNISPLERSNNPICHCSSRHSLHRKSKPPGAGAFKWKTVEIGRKINRCSLDVLEEQVQREYQGKSGFLFWSSLEVLCV